MADILSDGKGPGLDCISMVSGYDCLSKMDSLALKEKSENFQTDLKNALGVISIDQRKNEKEMQLLKELIVSHLDVIQQQSEQLAIKDRLINKLKNDKETLEMRLLRMERRVNLDRGRGEAGPQDLTRGSHPAVAAPQASAARAAPLRRVSTESSGRAAHLAQQTGPSREVKRSRRPRTNNGEGEAADRGGGGGKLVSERLYYTSVGEQECRWAPEPPAPSQARHQSLLEVPSWRVRSYSSSYTMEGTENLSDEVFERRHSSLCKDEKRRKRWDVQRIREMRHNERLRQRMAQQSGAKSSDEGTESLWPAPTRRTQLIVHQTVPVAALGTALHSLPPRDFLFSSFSFPNTKSLRFGKRLRR